jgi:peroxin-16
MVHIRLQFDLFKERNFFNRLITYFVFPLVLALQKYGNRSWRPWLLSIFIELSTRVLRNYFYKKNTPGGYRLLSTLEKEENKRRFRLLFFYILRGPFYEKFTRYFFKLLLL